MGFFDKIKKALLGKEEPNDQELKAEQAPQDEAVAGEHSETPKETTEVTQEALEETPLVDEPTSEETTAETPQAMPAAPTGNPVADNQVQETTPSAPDVSDSIPGNSQSDNTSSENVSRETIYQTIPADKESLPTSSVNAAEEPVTEETSTATPETIESETAEEITEKYDKGLKKSRKTFGQRLNELFANFRSVDEDFFEEVEETLIGADVGFDAAMRIADEMRQEVKLKNVKKPKEVQNVIIEKLVNLYDEAGEDENHALNIQPNDLTVMLFVGVNGVGKTTSIGKLAYEYRMAGKKVLMAAADTFRAGAIDQLVVWGERSGVEVIRHNAGGDPAAVVFDAVKKAKEEHYDVLLVDTAGRLQNKVNLMKELDKIKRVIQREVPAAPHEVLLVVDATTGQNAMVQAKQFKETTDVSGIVLTKLDGTAKGGIVLAIRNELHLPVKLVGLGEGIDDLEVFDPNQFVIGLFKGLIQE